MITNVMTSPTALQTVNFRLAATISNLLVIINSSSNFVLYSSLSTKFRLTFTQLCCRHRRHAKYAGVGTGHVTAAQTTATPNGGRTRTRPRVDYHPVDHQQTRLWTRTGFFVQDILRMAAFAKFSGGEGKASVKAPKTPRSQLDLWGVPSLVGGDVHPSRGVNTPCYKINEIIWTNRSKIDLSRPTPIFMKLQQLGKSMFCFLFSSPL